MKNLKKFLAVALSAVLFLCYPTVYATNIKEDKTVYLGGDAFGVKFYSNGLLVVELESYFDGAKYICPANDGGLKVNDIIKEVDGEIITTNEDLQRKIINSQGNSIYFKIERNGNILQKKITPYKSTSGMYLVGIWVRDSCAGIGTVTYYDSDSNYFAALGHGICDNDTKALLPLARGEIVKAEINGINKSTSGNPGSLSGYFTEEKIGNLTKNTPLGIYGTVNTDFIADKKLIEIADCDEVKRDKAYIYTTINGCVPQYYEIKVTKICNRDKNSNENFVIKITDDELLDKCGGIVQGMSGSPIVQNGKLIGAVTHVFLNNPESGYGIFIENMIEIYG